MDADDDDASETLEEGCDTALRSLLEVESIEAFDKDSTEGAELTTASAPTAGSKSRVGDS